MVCLSLAYFWEARFWQMVVGKFKTKQNKISPGCSLEGLMMKLKLQYAGHLMWRAESFEKTLMLGKIEGRRRKGWQRMRGLDGITNSMDVGLGGLRELMIDRETWRAEFMGLQSRTWLSDWTELNWELIGSPRSIFSKAKKMSNARS